MTRWSLWKWKIQKQESWKRRSKNFQKKVTPPPPQTPSTKKPGFPKERSSLTTIRKRNSFIALLSIARIWPFPNIGNMISERYMIFWKAHRHHFMEAGLLFKEPRHLSCHSACNLGKSSGNKRTSQRWFEEIPEISGDLFFRNLTQAVFLRNIRKKKRGFSSK